MPVDILAVDGSNMQDIANVRAIDIDKTQAATVAFLSIDVTIARLPASIGVADCVPDIAISAHRGKMKISAYRSTTHIVEAQRTAIAFLVIDVGIARLPASISVTDCMPDHTTLVNATDMKILAHDRTISAAKTQTSAIAFLIVDVAVARLPASISVTDRMPDIAIGTYRHKLEFIANGARTTHIVEAQRTAIAFLVIDVGITRLPASIGVADRVPDHTTCCQRSDMQVAADTSTICTGKA